MTAIANHLWQSTLFAVVAWLLTRALKNQRAQSRYALWLVASLKFLIPFALLAEAGTWIPRHAAPIASAPAAVVYVFNQPFSTPLPHQSPAVAPTTDYLLPLILLVWGCGVAFVSATSFLRWRRVAKFARLAQPAPIERPGIRVLFTPSRLGLVWWIERQLVKERERACDEEVLRSGNDPEIYAEAILKTCRFYLESPLTCAAGVTGSNLSRRIEQIMTAPVARGLDFGRKLLLIAAGLGVVTAPVIVGMMDAPRLRAQIEKLGFEVASVKENKSQDRQIQMQYLPGGKFVVRNMPLWVILTTALDLPFNNDSGRITGQPDWIMRTRYDIEASPPAGIVPAAAPLPFRIGKTRPMLQALLEERFKLKLRREIAERQVYFVTVARGGPKLQKSARDEKTCVDATSDFGNSAECHSFGGGQGRGLHAEAATIADMAEFVSNFADRPVIDKTGLTGLYKFDTEGWSPMRAIPRPPNQEPTEEDRRFADALTPTLFQIFDRLGLKLESSKAPIETFVIESIERPTEN